MHIWRKKTHQRPAYIYIENFHSWVTHSIPIRTGWYICISTIFIQKEKKSVLSEATQIGTYKCWCMQCTVHSVHRKDTKTRTNDTNGIVCVQIGINIAMKWVYILFSFCSWFYCKINRSCHCILSILKKKTLTKLTKILVNIDWNIWAKQSACVPFKY